MLLSTVVQASDAVAATRSRNAKVAALAEALGEAGPADVETLVTYLGGNLHQRRTGLGWRSLTSLPSPAAQATLTVAGVDAAFEHLAGLSGPGSQTARAAAVTDLFAQATAPEQRWLRGAITGEVRQGAKDALVQEALAATTGAPLADLRRAVMLAGSTPVVARAAVTGGTEAVAAFRLEVGRPVQPMLASSEPDADAALARVGTPAVVDTKLDGIRIQAHRHGGEVLVVTRTLEDITVRLPEVVEVMRSLDGGDLVLDGEAIALDPDGRERPFQETASRTATRSGEQAVTITPYFFDLLLADGEDLLDRPTHERLSVLASLVPAANRTTTSWASSAEEVEAALTEATAGHEGLVLKSADAGYAAGRRGAAWVKLKPVHTLDLVVLAVEWGSGRRRGWLSNIHLGARDPESGGLAMVGKTFKGMTDETLAWQTERFLQLEIHRDGHVVHVRHEQVVEIALDGAQTSPRYPGGLALRFARVVGYRSDKRPAEADTLAAVRALG